MVGLVGKALARMKMGTAAGLDYLPAAFVKCARVRVGREWRHILTPMLGEMFVVCMREGVLPAPWKVARISPLYKKGPLLERTSYRMLAVSSVLYRLYANCLRTPVTDWCVAEGKIPAEQFGFYPGRDTAQPCFVLRHVCHAARWAKRKGERRDSRVYAAFVDFTAAYDTINRERLWQHLAGIGMPPWMLGAVQGMYAQDSYILVDGERWSRSLQPTLGVKQGCPLSPLLFSLYLSDFGARAVSPTHGVPLFGSPGRRITFMFYADDLVLLAESQATLQSMLSSLRMYSLTKGLTVNVGKSKVVVFNSRQGGTQGSGPVLTYNGERLSVDPHFKYLGLVFHRQLCMSGMQEPLARALLGSSMRARRIAREFGVHKDALAGLRLFQSFAFPSGMYGCQVWGTRYAHMSQVFASSISVRHLCALRRLLGVSRSSYRWAVLAELDTKPYHFYWLKALLKFQESVVQSNSALLAEVVQADARLSRDVLAGPAADGSGGVRCTTCWSAELANALVSIGEAAGIAEQGETWADRIRQGLPLGCRAVVQDALLSAYNKLAWQECMGQEGLVRSADLAPNLRKRLAYHTYFKPSQPGPPAHLRLDPELHKHVRQLSRFRLGCHHLRVETGRHDGIAWQARTCSRCSAAHLSTLTCTVDDEYHMIFECERFEALRSNAVEFVPGARRFVPGARTLINNAGGSVRRFMEGDPHTVLRFTAGCMDILDDDARNSD